MSAPAGAPVTRVIAVDWSGARDASGVYVAEVADGVVRRLEAPGSRERAVADVVAAAREAGARGERVVAGFDFAFSYPAWYLRERGCPDAPSFWDLVAREGEGWLREPAYPFWTLRTRRQGAPAERAFRITERAAAGGRVSPKSVFQVAGPGQVGTMSIRGIPLLRDLRAGGLAVWPFDDPGAAQSVVVEIYPRAYYGDAVVKGDAEHRRAYLDRYRAATTEAQRAAAVENDHAFDALVSALTMWERRDELAALAPVASADVRLEGWIWGPTPPAA